MTKTTEEGPYRIEDAWSGSFKKGKVVGPSLSKEDIFPGTPETLCDMLNAAWLAGRSSVTAQVGEPVAWMASRSHDYRMDVISDAWKKDSPADGNMNKTFTIPLYAAPSTVPLSPEMVELLQEAKAIHLRDHPDEETDPSAYMVNLDAMIDRLLGIR